MSGQERNAPGGETDIQPWDSDHTALVHVLWRAGVKGREADRIASTVMRSGWLRAVKQHAVEGHQERRMSGAEHPEETCRRCGGPNVSWFAPSPLWNAVMRGGSIDGPHEFGELICPTCFAVLAEERGIASEWRLHAQRVNVELETVTPSGRAWDDDADMWVAPIGPTSGPTSSKTLPGDGSQHGV